MDGFRVRDNSVKCVTVKIKIKYLLYKYYFP